jgi:hypothetical protein
MAKPVIPQGFVLDEANTQQTGLPSGFVLDEPQELSQPRMSMGEAAFTTATNPLGFGDEIKAGIAAGVAKLFGGAATQNIDIGDLYREARTAERVKLERARQERPLTSFAGQVFSDVGVAGKGLKALGLAGQGMGAAVKGGAALGGASALGETEDLTNIPQTIKDVATGAVAGGVVGGAVQKAIPAAQSAVGAISQAPKKVLQKITGVKPEAVKTFQELGIKPTLADVSNSAGIQNFVKDIPVAGKPITEALQKQVNDISSQIQNVVSVKPKTYARTGKMIKEGAEEFEKFAGQRVSGLYDDLDRQILNETQEMTSNKLSSAIDEWSQLKAIEGQIIGEIEVNAKSAALNSQFAQKQLGFWRNRTLADSGKLTTMAANDAKDLNNLKKLISKKESEIANYEKYLSPNQLKSVLATGEVTVPTSNTLKSINDFSVENVAAVSDGVSRTINRYKNIVDEAGNMPYPQLRMFRTTIGRRLQTPSISEDERMALNTIYKSLSEDMKDAVALYGGTKGLQAFDKANAAFKRKTEFIENIIDPVLKAKTATKAYKKAISPLKEDATIAKNLMSSLKPIQQEYVRASIVRDMGLVSKAKQGAEGNVFSPQKFMAEYSVLKKNGTEKAIFTPEQITAFNRLNKVVELTKNTEQAGQQRQLMQAIGLGTIGGTTGVGGLATTMVGARISANLMTNPKFINWLAITAQATPKELPKQLNRLSVITAANPEIREDVLQFLSSFGVNEAEANDGVASEEQFKNQLLEQKQKYPMLAGDIDVEQEVEQYKKRYLK